LKNNVSTQTKRPSSDKLTFSKTVSILVTVLTAVIFSNVVNAKNYKIEVLVFENNSPSFATESSNYIEPREARSGSSTWPLEPSMLLDQANRIKNSSNYRLLHHFSWGQKALPYGRSANYSVAEQDARGFIKVYAEQLLFANIDLDVSGYRMNEKRRLKLNERHFFDHPKFGILMQVSRLEKKAEPQ